MSIAYIIKGINSKLSKTEKKIAEFILENTTLVKEITSADLAKRAGVGQSSVIKFIKKIGFEGFTDFKIKLSEELATKKIIKPEFLHNNISLDDSICEATRKISFSHMKSIEETIHELSFETLEAVINKLEKAEKIIILGIGASSLVGKDLQHKLTKIGMVALHDLDFHVQVTQAVCASSKDLILAISHSGESRVVIEALKGAEKNKASVVSITGSEKNSIASLSHINLHTVNVEGTFRSSALSSRIAQLTIIDALFIGLLKRDYIKPKEYIERSRKIISKLNS